MSQNDEIQLGQGGFAERVRAFMFVGGQTVDKFNLAQTGLYVGLMFEELSETLEVISHGCVSSQERVRLTSVISLMKQMSMEFREGKHSGDIMRCDHAKLLDGFIDTAVVSVGGAVSFSPNALGAVAAVLDANDAKFPGGVATRTADGKIRKPEGWREANLTPFVPVIDRDRE